MCKRGTQVVVDLPEWLWPERETRTVCIDSCIVENVRALWDSKIYTLGSCCGHDGEFGNPSVILHEHEMKQEDVERALSVLHGIDGRKWTIKQWRLVDVG